MNYLTEKKIECPYCGESIEVQIDCSVSQQNYIEDCQVCCRPIEFDVTIVQDTEPLLIISREDD